jgi:hypothetical protein
MADTVYAPSPVAHCRERRILDYETLAASFPDSGGTVAGWCAFRSVAAAHVGETTRDPAQAAVFHVWLDIASPVEADTIARSWCVRLDASGASYPTTPPIAHFLAPNRPWNPHVRQVDGLVCVGTLWLPSKLLAFYVLDILRVLNFDFGLDPHAQLGHYQPRAVSWWLDRHAGRPLASGVYPTIVTPDVRRVIEDRADDPFGAIVSEFAGGSR